MSGSAEDAPAAVPHKRSRWAVVLSVALLCGVAAAGWAVVQATDRECREIAREDLSLAEMGQLRRLVDAYKSHPERPMHLTARQVSFLLREEFEIVAWVALPPDSAEIEARFPTDGYCWAMSFGGSVSVDHARLTLIPDRLTVGDLSLGWLLDGVRLDFGPDQMPTPQTETLLRHLTTVSRDGAELLVQVDDPKWLR